MFCAYCGALNADSAKTCTACGKPLIPITGSAGGSPPPLPVEAIPNYLPYAILTTLCCGCPPFGIVAIVYSAQVNGKLAAGDVEGARQASNSAKMWCWISFGVGVLLVVGNIVVSILAQLAPH